LELNVTHQLVVYADHVSLLGEHKSIIKGKEALLDASKEVGLEVKAEKLKYEFTSRHQNTGRNHYINISNKYFENAAKLNYIIFERR
jgi:protein associated with RNAse G/E